MRILGRRLMLAWLVLAMLVSASVATARFRQTNEEYAARRAKLVSKVDGPVVVFGYTGHEDLSEFAVFFQEKNFYYLTGDDEPGGAVLSDPRSAGGQNARRPARNPLSSAARSARRTLGRSENGSRRSRHQRKDRLRGGRAVRQLARQARRSCRKSIQIFTRCFPDSRRKAIRTCKIGANG